MEGYDMARLEIKNLKYRYPYTDRLALDGITCTIEPGEFIGVIGKNGSGKSTLLSLVYADNPKSYSNTLYLFDRKRGTGESIWDIKSRIGYVSPEMHLYFMEDIPMLRMRSMLSTSANSSMSRPCSVAQVSQSVRLNMSSKR